MTVDSIVADAKAISTKAAELETLRSQIDRLVNEAAQVWEGSDVRAFRTAWTGTYAPRMRTAITRLNDMSRQLTQQADQQRKASVADIKVSAAKVTPLGGLTGGLPTGGPFGGGSTSPPPSAPTEPPICQPSSLPSWVHKFVKDVDFIANTLEAATGSWSAIAPWLPIATHGLSLVVDFYDQWEKDSCDPNLHWSARLARAYVITNADNASGWMGIAISGLMEGCDVPAPLAVMGGYFAGLGLDWAYTTFLKDDVHDWVDKNIRW